ncbi:MAG: hypothetical protein CSA89_00995 [Bacteroidales bacterium]|nr:MAG: hypothetical protein CSA89_00995 [Bacteroidales bacterium]
MIQRIQTIYLFFVVILGFLTICMPLVEHKLYLLDLNMVLAQSLLVVTGVIFAFAMPLLVFVVIFLYKNRRLQMKLCWVTIAMIVVYYLCIGLWAYSRFEFLYEQMTMIDKISVALNMVSLFFVVLALLSIKKDENLIKSLDRLR